MFILFVFFSFLQKTTLPNLTEVENVHAENRKKIMQQFNFWYLANTRLIALFDLQRD